jgi:hypothetical protein
VISLVFFLFLAGLTAIGFLEVVRRRREMPALLRGLLTIGAIAILVYVAWTLWVVLR